MREIKFRAFDTREGLNRMWYLHGFVKYGEGWEGGNPDYKFYEIYFGAGFAKLDAKTTVIMQFTGLCDKNGKEIYEGDLLGWPDRNENYSCFEVFFHDGDANVDYNIGFSIARMYKHGNIAGGYIPSFKPKTTMQMEVIGNIYENPELKD